MKHFLFKKQLLSTVLFSRNLAVFIVILSNFFVASGVRADDLDYSLSPPDDITVVQGQSNSTTISVDVIDPSSSTQTVNLSISSVRRMSDNVLLTIDQASDNFVIDISPSSGSDDFTSTIGVTATAIAELGSYTAIVVGHNPILANHHASFVITVAVDLSALIAAISSAQTKHDNAIVGITVGNYPQNAVNNLAGTIATAISVRDNSSSTQAVIDAIVTALNDAIVSFNNAVISFDYSLSQPSNITISQGQNGLSEISVSFSSSSTQTVNLSISSIKRMSDNTLFTGNQADGITVSLSPADGNADFTSSISVASSTDTPLGDYRVIIIGPNAFTHNESFTVSMVAPVTPPIVDNIPITSDNNNNTSGNRSSNRGSNNNNFTTPALIKIDTNNDGKVNIFDFITLMANWGKTGSNNTADFNSDGKIDILDFVLLMANWTK